MFGLEEIPYRVLVIFGFSASAWSGLLKLQLMETSQAAEITRSRNQIPSIIPKNVGKFLAEVVPEP